MSLHAQSIFTQAAENNRMNRRQFLGVSAAALGSMALMPGYSSASSTGAKQKRPNIVFILTDNQPTWMLGCYGSKTVKTPNIDRLASEGIRFTRAFACNGLCSPTRASLMTGLMPSQHGIHDWIQDTALPNYPKDWCAVQEFRTLPVTLANRGYRTAMIGKYHMGQPTHVMPGFQHWVTFPYGHTLDFWNNTIFENGRTYELKGRHIVEFFARKGAEYIREQKGDKPFYLQLNFDGPYLLPPTNLGKDNNRFYADYTGSEFADWPKEELDPVYDFIIGGRPDNPNDFNLNLAYQIKKMHLDPASMANTASQNAVVDYGVKLVMDALKEAGLDEDTLVVYATDQADSYGQHGLYGHTNMTIPSRLYDGLMNVPFIVRRPGTIPAGQVSDLMIGQYDIMPTLLDAAGFGNVTVANSPGRSFMPYLYNKSLPAWHDEIYYEQEETRGIRTTMYAYWKRLHTGKAAWKPALFDIQGDPGQYKDLYGKPGYETIVAELDAKVNAFFARYADPQYDLWKQGKTKSYTSRTAHIDQAYGMSWQPDYGTKPLFADTV